MLEFFRKLARSFRLKGSFYSVLILIQALLVFLSVIYTRITLNILENRENEIAETFSKYVTNELEKGTTSAMLVATAVANNDALVEAFAQRDRPRLIERCTTLWTQLEAQGIKQLSFHQPTPAGIINFLRMHEQAVHGELISTSRAILYKVNQEKIPVVGLEQGKSGYGFRAVLPLFRNGEHIGSLEIGTKFDDKFLAKLDRNYPGKWSVVNLERGIATVGDGAIIASFNETEDMTKAKAVRPRIIEEIKMGNSYHESDAATQTVSVYVPVRNFKGDVVAFIKHTSATDYYARLRNSIFISVAVCLVGLVLSGIIILVLYRQITIPIRGLVIETEKIKNFQLEERVHVPASLFEIRNLVDAIASMKAGLQSFKKYVPSELVRELIRSGQEAKISGQRKELTIFFSDIAHFTTISETLKPTELAAQLSEYLDALTKIIIDTQGTVDKYIGDAVMAFWGAPVDVEMHARQACIAALRIQARVKELGKKWEGEGKKIFNTRIGINTGGLIVGNMGSEQRMNYTVIGDPVNVASRLEVLNKRYGTSILISESTYRQCKNDVEVRLVDFAIVKGRTEAITIYELIAEKGDISTIDLEFYTAFDEGVTAYRSREFQQAMKIFASLSRKRPDDIPARMFLERSTYFSQHAPHEEWRGEYKLDEK